MNCPIKLAKHGVVLEQVGKCLGIGHIVYRDDVHVYIPRSSEEASADSAEAVNPYVDQIEEAPFGQSLLSKI
ncbi:hypothetical protein A3K71_06950 [archaeon RBG_16_50_20]|nr:MAG: hypothetical protein A3K71_06950 [archaeon RBG_16_50_20]